MSDEGLRVGEAREDRSGLRARFSGWVRRERAHFEEAQQAATGRFGAFEAGLLITAAVGLTVMNFLGNPRTYLQLFQPDRFSTYWLEWGELTLLLHWITCCVIGYGLIPVLYLLYWRRSLSEYYLSFRGFGRHLPLYLLLLTPVSLLVLWVSHWPDFQQIYPFYTLAGRSWRDLLIWELAYGLQFVVLEFFFRSFLLEGLRPAIGYGAIWVMVVPYCCIHFQKTAAESLGSIIAGVVLGWMALRTRSIWGGVLAHWLIAVEMDVMSLFQRGSWPPGGVP